MLRAFVGPSNSCLHMPKGNLRSCCRVTKNSIGKMKQNENAVDFRERKSERKKKLAIMIEIKIIEKDNYSLTEFQSQNRRPWEGSLHSSTFSWLHNKYANFFSISCRAYFFLTSVFVAALVFNGAQILEHEFHVFIRTARRADAELLVATLLNKLNDFETYIIKNYSSNFMLGISILFIIDNNHCFCVCTLYRVQSWVHITFIERSFISYFFVKCRRWEKSTKHIQTGKSTQILESWLESEIKWREKQQNPKKKILRKHIRLQCSVLLRLNGDDDDGFHFYFCVVVCCYHKTVTAIRAKRM